MYVVITRHPAFFTLCVEYNLCSADAEVIAQATEDTVRGKKVLTSGLPLALAVLAAEVTTIPLTLAPAQRGRELGIEELREAAGKVRTFRVVEV